jgi:hypothetical protein
MTDTSLATKILESAQAPKRVRGDEAEVESHSLPDQIAADQYLRQTAMSKNPFKAIKRVRMLSPGAV